MKYVKPILKHMEQWKKENLHLEEKLRKPTEVSAEELHRIVGFAIEINAKVPTFLVSYTATSVDFFSMPIAPKVSFVLSKMGQANE